MTYIQSCWSPCWCNHNVKQGSIAVAIYTIIMSIVGMFYAIWVMSGGQSSDLYSPFFETDVRKGAQVLGGFVIGLCLIFLIASLLLWYGIAKSIRGFLLPWIGLVTLLSLFTLGYGIFFVARYYIDPHSVLAAVYTWLITGLNVYCLLCVLSHYQIIKMYQSPHLVVLYP